MSADFWLPILSIALWVVVPVAVFLARNWLLAWISKGVQHRFDVKLEELRAELRKNEEGFKSDLRDKEAEISTLRNTVLSGSASRQGLLDKRRFEAVEKVWDTVNDLARLKPLSGMMAVLNLKEVANEVKDPRMQQVLKIIGAGVPDIQDLKNVAANEQPFLPELAWAYFAAYRTILIGNLFVYTILKTGVEESHKYFSYEGAKKILKVALPHQTKFIDEHEPETYYYLLEEIEACLLAELRKILEGKEVDQATVLRAKEIMDVVNHVDAERAEQAIANVKAG
jgi:hypothetical protein